MNTSQVCKASDFFFNQLKGSENETKAVSYFINSPEISLNKTYKCGDSELELMLD